MLKNVGSVGSGKKPNGPPKSWEGSTDRAVAGDGVGAIGSTAKTLDVNELIESIERHAQTAEENLRTTAQRLTARGAHDAARALIELADRTGGLADQLRRGVGAGLTAATLVHMVQQIGEVAAISNAEDPFEAARAYIPAFSAIGDLCDVFGSRVPLLPIIGGQFRAGAVLLEAGLGLFQQRIEFLDSITSPETMYGCQIGPNGNCVDP